MAEQWELCELDDSYLYIASPKGVTAYKHEDFLRRFAPSYDKESNKTMSYYLVLTNLLAENWEPFAAVRSTSLDFPEYHIFLRRKYQG